MPPTCRAPRPAPRCAGPLPVVESAGTVASGASIKPGEALQREPLDAADVPRPSTCPAAKPGPMPVARSAARPSMPRILGLA
jgi:hypothetical protein